MRALDLLNQLDDAPLADRTRLARRFREAPPTHAELGVAFRRLCRRDRNEAIHLAEAYAEGLPDLGAHRAFFQPCCPVAMSDQACPMA